MKKLKFNFFIDMLVIALVAAYAFFIVFQVDHEVPNVIVLNEPELEMEEQTIIKVMTYNIAHGRGHLSMYEKSAFGRNFNIKSEDEVLSRLDKIAELVREENIDILILEEADFDASWSYHVDEAQYIAAKAGFNNVVEGLKWSINLPYLKIRAGNAILSKYPLMFAEVKKFDSEKFFRRFVGGHSYIDATYLVNGKPVRILASHFDSDSTEAREKEAEELIDATWHGGTPVIVAGDLNAVTLEAKLDSEYLRNKFTDRTIETFVESGLFNLDTELLNPTDESMYTYSAEDPHRLIDFIFTTPDLEVTEYYVRRENLSDHFPLVARIIV